MLICMARRRWSEEELEAAIERLSAPERLREAEAAVAAAAPKLQHVLAQALEAGGWFGEAHEAETLKAATTPDEDERLRVVRTLLAEETRMGMLVGTAVGWALANELSRPSSEPAAGEEARQEEDPMGEVEFQANGGTATGYLAEPEGEGPGVVVLQEWWGVDEHIRDVCDRFANEGFVALAPDLYHGETTDQPSEAEQKMMALNMGEAEREMRGAVDYLAGHEKCNGAVGTVGFCLGGGLSVWAASANPKVSAVSTFYYVMPHGKPDFSRIDAPVLGHFGTADDFVSTEDAQALEQELREAGVETSFEYYENAGHAFFNDTDRLGTHDPEHARNAWQRTVDFFRRHLSASEG